jgi:tetratricopeptide (TPR) repeat protein
MSANHERAWAALSRDRHDLAEREFRLVLTEDPDDAYSHAGLALSLCHQERFDEAEREVKLAIGLAPDVDFCHYVHGTILRDRNRPGEAAAAAEEAIRLDPEDADNRFLLAGIRGQQERWEDCLACADAGLAIDAEHDGCTNLRALALTQLGRKDEASATIAGALERSPENSMTHANQGLALLHRNDPTSALDHFREALRLDPSNDFAREGLLTALKARNPVFRVLVAYFLFMSRQRSAMRWVIILGVFFGQGMLRSVAKNHPELGIVVYPLVALVAVFIYSTWLADPLMNLVMRFDRYGRHALTDDQRRQSNLVGGCLLVAAGMFISEWQLGLGHVPSLMCLLLSLPLASIHDSAVGWPRRVSSLVGGVFALMAAYATAVWYVIGLGPKDDTALTPLLDGLVAGGFLVVPVFFLGVLAWTFIGPAIVQRAQPAR